ncbi:hypothetical protein TCAL_10986 [Tigriopus californicus]|uniref:6-phosphogluconolactonase n=1 Tax=Tigriopus californicus TaxID=6832 RepID=A0A553NAX7_TIGCA|nr:6-phosphogluconolactonase-like [Tigriopus californicus]TRY62594.1 hypothetical protein TCAL_10986 [Tigriopus californicus]|eukprot:TCALIF_10986-PA protein Name:"Similar to Pgls 6-phosphogluconolactonase (Rattus norvegicus)" AED:0.01 eAED:0.01 QI:0/-1/0/1/-1/1/1/0/242
MAKIVIGKDGDEVSSHLCQAIEKQYESYDPSGSRPFVIGLSGGSLPKFFAAGAPQMTKINWNKVKFIFCDERLVSFDDPESTFKVYRETFISKVNGVTKDQFVVIDPTKDVEACAQDYQEQLAQLDSPQDGSFPIFDVLLLGMGPDGHTCSLFPGHPLLDEQSRIVASISDSPKPPPNRVTLTLPVLNKARACIFVSTGEGKKEILKKILEDKEDFPAGRVKPETGTLTWILDAPAASLLKL